MLGVYKSTTSSACQPFPSTPRDNPGIPNLSWSHSWHIPCQRPRIGRCALPAAVDFVHDFVDRGVTQHTAVFGRIITLARIELLKKSRHPDRTECFCQRINFGAWCLNSASVALPPSIGSTAAFIAQLAPRTILRDFQHVRRACSLRETHEAAGYHQSSRRLRVQRFPRKQYVTHRTRRSPESQAPCRVRAPASLPLPSKSPHSRARTASTSNRTRAWCWSSNGLFTQHRSR